MRTIFAFLLSAFALHGATTNRLDQWGITWLFEDAVEYGQFINGDYWVLAPVTVTNILPERVNWPDGMTNGFEINPTFSSSQAMYWETGNLRGYTTNKYVLLPFTISNSNASIVKVIRGTISGNSSLVKSAGVLTVLTNAPADGGAEYFRPVYAGTNKTLHHISEFQTNMLPAYATVPNATTLDGALAAFSKCLRLDLHANYARSFRPYDAMKDYQPENTTTLNNTMLRLMMDDPIEDKMPAVIMFAQHALDRAYIIEMGYRDAGTGHNPNQRIVAAWGATMFNLTNIISYMSTRHGFHEDDYLTDSPLTGRALWGQSNTVAAYWNYLYLGDGNKGNRDPHFLIDGGGAGSPDGRDVGYMPITAQSIKGTALIAKLMPELQECFPSNRWSTTWRFAERFVTNGYWMQPDDAAPDDGINANYQITYGPTPGYTSYADYIKGAGRRPDRHGWGVDSGLYKSAFVASMWTAYVTGEGGLTNPPSAPSIHSVIPTQLPRLGGEVELTGELLTNATNVTVGGIAVDFRSDLGGFFITPPPRVMTQASIVVQTPDGNATTNGALTIDSRNARVR